MLSGPTFGSCESSQQWGRAHYKSETSFKFIFKC